MHIISMLKYLQGAYVVIKGDNLRSTQTTKETCIKLIFHELKRAEGILTVIRAVHKRYVDLSDNAMAQSQARLTRQVIAQEVEKQVNLLKLLSFFA